MQTNPLVTAVARYDLTHLSDGALLAGTRRLVGTSNQLFADLLAHLAEVEARGIHRARACASLYTYCIYELRFSEDAAFRRVTAARLVKTFPALFDAVAAGELHLTGLLLVGPHLTHANHLEVLARAKHHTKRELVALIRQIDPLPNVPARIEALGPAVESGPTALRAPTWEQYVTSFNPVRELAAGERPRDWIDESNLTTAPRDAGPAPARKPSATDDARPAPARKPSATDDAEPAPARSLPALSWPIQGPQRYSVQFTATEEYAHLVERAQALLSQTPESCAIVELHLRAMRTLVAQLEKRKYAATSKESMLTSPAKPAPPTPTPAPPSAAPWPTTCAAENEPQEPRARSRHIPAPIRREVYRRDEARCTYVDSNGARCRETHHLELHHRKPFAARGEHSAQNLTLHCRAHNALAAERDFGRAHMDRKRTAERHESMQTQ